MLVSHLLERLVIKMVVSPWLAFVEVKMLVLALKASVVVKMVVSASVIYGGQIVGFTFAGMCSSQNVGFILAGIYGVLECIFTAS
jgi:hypothetical protein